MQIENLISAVLQMETEEKYFSFVVKTEFDTKVRYDQSGIVMYLDSDNWLKASVEYENDKIQRLGSVVTNNGYSDWASVDIDASVKSMWFRLSRRDDDFCIENSTDGKAFKQMRICHMFNVKDRIQFGVYACTPYIVKPPVLYSAGGQSLSLFSYFIIFSTLQSRIVQRSSISWVVTPIL